MGKQKYSFHDREVSWLSFNERVLQEAEDANVPLIERLRFLGIYSNNLDEFFRVRVPTVQRMIRYGKKAIPLLGFDPKKTLKAIYQINKKLQDRFEQTYEKLKDELEEEHIFFLDETELNEEQRKLVARYFEQVVQPALVPVMLSEDRALPELNGKAIYLAIKLYNKKSGKNQEARYALLEIPTAVVSRFYVMADQKGNNFVSIASIWEISIKLSLGKFNFNRGFKSFLELIENNGFDIIPFTFQHALIISSLEFKHRDPFDRLIIAQAIAENCTVVTKDKEIEKYDINTFW